MEAMKLNERIRNLCRERHVKQISIARKINISPSHMSQIIHGRRPVKSEQLPGFASCLGVTIDELFGIEHKKGLEDYSRIIIETDEENPVTIADITLNEIDVVNGYRARAKPVN